MNTRKNRTGQRRQHRGSAQAPTPGNAQAWNPAGRDTLILLLVLALVGWTILVFPRLTLPFSDGAAAVASLDVDVFHDGIGLTPEQQDGIREAIGTRPVAMVFVPEDQDDPDVGDLCQAISPRLPRLELVLVAGPGGSYGCSGDDVPFILGEGQKLFGAQAGYEMRISGALGLVTDPVGKAQALALVHDSMVMTGRLAEEERSLRTPWLQVLTTLLIVAGVLAAVVLTLTGLRWWAHYLAARKARRERQEELRDRLDDALAELALVVVARTPDDPRRQSGDGAAEYVELLTLARSIDGGWGELLARATTLLEQKSGKASRRKDRR